MFRNKRLIGGMMVAAMLASGLSFGQGGARPGTGTPKPVANTQGPGAKSDFVVSAPAGNYVWLNIEGQPFRPGKSMGYTVDRSVKGENKFSKVGSFAPVQSYKEFQDMVGTSLAAEFRSYIKAKTDADVVRFFNTTHANKEYGFFVLDVNFLRALGLVVLDPGAPDKMLGYEYRLMSATNATLKQQTPVAFNRNSLPRGQVKKIFTTDSLVSIRWDFPVSESGLPLFAKVYRQEDGEGKYVPTPLKTNINVADGKSYAVYESATTPEQLVNYYIVPMDLMGNEGLPSDTATAISINYKKIPGLTDIIVTDTLGGLYSTWKPLAAKPYYTAIQILRSRDARKDFIVLDSVSALSTSYLDRQVLPNVTYFYKFRVIVYKLSGWDEIIATTVHGSVGSSKNPPLAPKGINAVKFGKNIRVSWDPNAELDLFAYYVLRGTSERNMEIVSPAIMDTVWVDSSFALSGRTNYVYSVVAMNNNQLKSDVSAFAGASPARGEFIAAPTGITIRPLGSKLMLTWPDVAKGDAAVAGYILYKRKATDKEFVAVGNALITRPYYEDAVVSANIGYVYSVSAVDRFGYESERSPDADYVLRERVMPPAQIFVRKLSTGVEVSWPRNADASDIVAYNIYRKNARGEYVKVGSAKASDGLYRDAKFVPNSLNVYAVTISTKDGESDKSVEKTVFVQ